MPINLPIVLTWLRIIVIPLLIIIYYVPATMLTAENKDFWATALFIVAAVTDWADGYIARRFDMVSAFGEFLDPVADKLMVSSALIMLVFLGRCPAFLAVIIIGREIAISALREWMSRIGAIQSVAVSTLGKVKTTFQLFAIPMLLFNRSFLGLPIVGIGEIFLWLAALLTLISMIYYLACAQREIAGRL